MYELIQVANNSYYVNCPAKIGVYRCNDTDIFLIDSGNDKDAGRKVRRVLEAEGWQVKAILTPTPTTPEATDIFSRTPAAKFSPRALKPASQITPFWSLPCCTAVRPARRSGISS